MDTLSTNTDEVIVGRADQYIRSTDNDSFFGDKTRPNKILVVAGVKCKGTTMLTTGSSRSVAVIGAMETANGVQKYCQDAE